jgi:PTH2 family peptidyl-tRNA hydrolase
MSNELKQVIVLRKDLNMRKGKMIAQGAHASMAVLTKRMVERDMGEGTTQLFLEVSENEREWIKEHFAKIALGVETGAELREIYEAALAAKLPASLITDEGLTEFRGVHTDTAVAIGPADRAKIDKITGHLGLL